MFIEENIFLSRIAEQSGRFDDMFHFLKKSVANKIDDFNLEERNLYQTAFKNKVCGKRMAIRALKSLVESQKYNKYRSGMIEYKVTLEESLKKDC